MDFELIKARFISFGYEAGVLALSAVVGYFTDERAQAIISEHFGETIVGSIVALFVLGLLKHARNLSVLRKTGGAGKEPVVLI